MIHRARLVSLLSGVSAAAMLLAGPAAAQGAAESGVGTIEELVVTAQRRETSLQDVPFSIMAFGGEELSRERLTDANALSSRVPSAVFNAAADKGFAVVGLRGARALLSSPAADLPVVFFFDDVYTSGVSSTGSTFFDVDHVEVLRGPQGTLFGRNVTGGAISVISNKPVFDDDWAASFTAGNKGQIGIEGMANRVIAEDLVAGRIAFAHRRNDGLIKNRAGPNLQQEDITAVRGQLLFTPSETLRINLSADYMHDTGTSNPAKMTCITPAGLDCTPALLPPLSSDPFVSDQDGDSGYKVEYYGATARVDWDFGDAGALTSITAFRRNVNYSARDPDTLPIPVYHLRAVTNDRQFTQEIRFASPSENRFSYVAGAFFLKQHNYRRDEYNELGIPGTPYGVSVPTPKYIELSQYSNNSSIAGFAEAAYKITPELTLSVGGRYTVDEKKGHTFIQGDPGNPRFRAVPTLVDFGPTKWKSFTPRVYLKYEPTDALNFYGTIAKGFKGGGYSHSQNSVIGLTTPFAPEKVTNYEVGAKTRLFDGRAQANLSIFRQDTKNLQVTYFENGASFTRSVGESRQQGVEFESTAQVTEALRLFLNYSYIDARYIEYNTGTASYAGNFMPFAPKNSVTVGGRYTHEINDDQQVSVSADYSYRSRLALADPNNVSRVVMDRSEWNMWNGSVDLESASGRWRVSLWGRNLTNDAPVQAAYDFGTFWLSAAERAAGNRGYLTYYVNPRTFGVTLSLRQ